MTYIKWLTLAILVGTSIWFFSSRSEKPARTEASQEIISENSKRDEPRIEAHVLPAPPPQKTLGSAPLAENLKSGKDASRPHVGANAENETAGLPTKNTVDHLGILRDSQGNLLKTRHEAAVKACTEQGMQLATIRELVSWGGKIFESRKDKEEEIPSGYRVDQVSAINPDGKKDEFYYVYNSSGGSFRPVGDLRDHFLWSSSINSKDTSEFYALDSTSGYVSVGEAPDPDPKFHFGAIRCVPKPKPKR